MTIRRLDYGLSQKGDDIKMTKVREYILRYPQCQKKNQKNLSNKPRVVVCSCNYSNNLSVARALGEAGYEVEILRIFYENASFLKQMIIPDAYSKYVKVYSTCMAGDNQLIFEQLLNMADSYQKKLFIPVDDLATSIEDMYYEKLQNYFYLPNISQKAGAINYFMQKDIQKQYAKQAGFSVANSCVLTIKNGCFDIPDTISYPCFIKPNVSKNASKRLITICKDENELKLFLESLSYENLELLVEELIDVKKEYGILGLSTKDGVIAPGFFVTEKGGHRNRKGITLTGKMLSCAQKDKIIDNVVNYLKALNYEGLFDVDLIESADGEIYFSELNLRLGASGYAVTKSGVNLLGMYADYIYFKRPIDLQCEVNTVGKLFLNERVLLNEYRDGYLTLRDVRDYMKKADISFMKNEKDMWPYRFFKMLFLVAPFERYLRLKYKKPI